MCVASQETFRTETISPLGFLATDGGVYWQHIIPKMAFAIKLSYKQIIITRVLRHTQRETHTQAHTQTRTHLTDAHTRAHTHTERESTHWYIIRVYLRYLSICISVLLSIKTRMYKGGHWSHFYLFTKLAEKLWKTF